MVGRLHGLADTVYGTCASFDAPCSLPVRKLLAQKIPRQGAAQRAVEPWAAKPSLLFTRRRADYAANGKRMQAARGHGQAPRALTTVTETPSADRQVDALRIRKISGWRTTTLPGT